MRTRLIAAIAAIVANTLAAPVHAQATAPGAAADAATVLTDGEIRKVDKAAGKLTIKHGEIRNLDMPPMTMVFQVKDKAMLDAVNPGDRVRFHVEKAAGGYVVTTLQRAP